MSFLILFLLVLVSIRWRKYPFLNFCFYFFRSCFLPKKVIFIILNILPDYKSRRLLRCLICTYLLQCLCNVYNLSPVLFVNHLFTIILCVSISAASNMFLVFSIPIFIFILSSSSSNTFRVFCKLFSVPYKVIFILVVRKSATILLNNLQSISL